MSDNTKAPTQEATPDDTLVTLPAPVKPVVASAESFPQGITGTAVPQ